MVVGLGPGDIVLDGDPALLFKKGGAAPQLSAHVHCGQTAGWIKMLLGMEVSLGPGHIVLCGDPNLPPPKKKVAQPPIFGPCLLWPNGWMDQYATLYEGGLSPGHIVLHGDPAYTPQFSVHVYCDQTVAHLSYC